MLSPSASTLHPCNSADDNAQLYIGDQLIGRTAKTGVVVKLSRSFTPGLYKVVVLHQQYSGSSFVLLQWDNGTGSVFPSEIPWQTVLGVPAGVLGRVWGAV